MTYFEDLSEYAYLPSRARMWNVGWLSPGHDFQRGGVRDDLVDRLALLADHPENKTPDHNDCHMCSRTFPLRVHRAGVSPLLGTAEIHVTDARAHIFAAPTLVIHYIIEHRYVPPMVFQDALDFGLAFPEMSLVGDETRCSTRFASPEPVGRSRAFGSTSLDFRVVCTTEIDGVIARVEEVLRAQASARPSPPPIPGWFRGRLVTGTWEERPEVLAAWRERSASAEARQRSVRAVRWGAADWHEDMAPGRRGWEWVGARPVDRHAALFTVELVAWPAPLTALLWLIKEAGGQVDDDMLA